VTTPGRSAHSGRVTPVSSILAFLFTTVASKPHITDGTLFEHNPLVLHVSLRDLAPEILLNSQNVVDDIDHVMKANTSPHLAEQKTGNRNGAMTTLIEDRCGVKVQ